MLIVIALQIYVLPSYFTSSVGFRIFVCLFLLPLLQNLSEVSGRMSAQGRMMIEYTNANDATLLTVCHPFFYGKVYFSLIKRFCLLNFGNPNYTVAAIVFSSIEEILMRVFVVEIDTAVRKFTGKQPLRGASLEFQK